MAYPKNNKDSRALGSTYAHACSRTTLMLLKVDVQYLLSRQHAGFQESL